jgi:GntR family transcriptional regulator/MocR family aminotransferase
MFLSLDGKGALSQQVYRALRSAILSRQLAPGARLPSTRALAAELGLSRNVVLFAYEQLRGEGYAVGRVGSGTVVSPTLPEPWAAAGGMQGRAAAATRSSPRLGRVMDSFPPSTNRGSRVLP